MRAADDDANDEKREAKNDEAPSQGGFASAEDWIANWKAGNFPRAKGWKFGDPSDTGTGTFTEPVAGGLGSSTSGGNQPGDDTEEVDLENTYGGDPNRFAYVFCHNMLGAPQDSFACLYLRDTLGGMGLDLLTPDLTEAGEGEGEFTVTSAVAALEAAIEAVPEEKRPVRIIGSSLGAYVTALYASKPENAANVDRIMLLAPTFKLPSVVDQLEKETGAALSDAFKTDAETHPEFPFVKCRAYVVHGYDDEVAPLENSLTWVRDASVNMREGSTENDGEAAEERRLLEVGGMSHGIENALPQIKAKLISFFMLPFTVPEGFE